MLVITVPSIEYFDEDKSEFFKTEEVTMQLEHSLVSLSKWESIYEKPFLSQEPKTDDETLTYVKCMNLTPNVPPETFTRLSIENLDAINTYIGAKRSATWFTEIPGSQKPATAKTITSELIYYWLIALNIPFTCEEWHLNRLFTLIKVCNEKNAPAKKMSPSEIAARNRRLNAERKAKFNTKG